MFMLSPLENIFVRVFRYAVVLTALLGFTIAIGGLAYAAFAQYSPEPTADLPGKISEFQQATNPAALIKQLFPADSSVYKEADRGNKSAAYQSLAASDEEIFNEFNKFLNASLDASFDNLDQFRQWLSTIKSDQFSWSGIIHDSNAANESNVEFLWRSLFFDYAKRLSSLGAVLGEARKQKLYKSSFDDLTAPTGPSRAPLFVVWFFQKLQGQLRIVDSDLRARQFRRNVLRLSTYPAIVTAASAFGYFIIVMFFFLLISIEASTRRIAEVHQKAFIREPEA